MNDLNEIYTEDIDDTPTVLHYLYKLNKKVDDYIIRQGYGTIIKQNGVPINSINLVNAPTENSQNLVKSGGIYSALALKQNKLTFDDSPTENSNNPVKSDGIYDALALKQDNLTFDNAPTEDSNNPVKSGGIYDALALKQDKINIYQHNLYIISTDWRLKATILNNSPTEFTLTSFKQWLFDNGFKDSNLNNKGWYMCTGSHRSGNYSAFACSAPENDFILFHTSDTGAYDTHITLSSLSDAVVQIM